ncbi:MAG: PT domain-containing protein [Eubacterium sp.]|nr:PT domain-containing protein [Eubacterium sp.]
MKRRKTGRRGFAVMMALCFMLTAVFGQNRIRASFAVNDKTYDLTDFEDYMDSEGFPESYKPYLRNMHEAHPEWVFKAVHTGISWDELIENERNKPGDVKNLIYGSYYYPHYNWRSTEVGYDWETDTYYSYDGYVWYAASDEILAYYMDPRTYLYEEYVFAFEALSYQEGFQNINGIEAILNGTFMYKTNAVGSKKNYSSIMLAAAKKYGVSAYHIASRIRQEMGTEPGVAALGNSSSYPGIFNYYNIGAYDSPDGNAILNGLRYAAGSGSYGRPWNTVSKSIMGGTEYIAGSFIGEGQDTIYTQKFNVTNQSCLYYNQYMSNIQAPASEANSQYWAYADNDLLDSSIVFKIPVYKNMPSEAVEKPDDSGSPNNWLSSLSVKKNEDTEKTYKLSSEFSGDVKSYSVTVPKSLDKVYISTSTVNENASVSGDGWVSIPDSTNNIKIVVTAQNGNKRVYKLKITKKTTTEEPTEEPTDQPTDEPTDEPTEEPTDEPSTDEPTEETTEEPTEEPVIIHKGDLSGDGKINALDIILVQRLIVGLDNLTDEKKLLADINGDDKVNALDIIFIQRHIVGLQEIIWD